MRVSPPEQEQATPIGAWRPFERVLVAAALGEAGATAVRRAARLPLAPRARLTVLHVAGPGDALAARGRPGPRAARPALEALAAEGGDAARAAGNEQPVVVPRLAEGSPATEIIRAAWEAGAELVVVGAPADRLDGSVGATIGRVIRKADLPVLVARTDPERDYRHVLCAVDRSVAAVDTIALAVRVAKPSAIGFTLLHAYHVPFEPLLREEPELEGEAVAHVSALARAMQGEVSRVRTLVRRGEAGIEVVRAAARERADLIAVGTHGRSGLGRLLLGSGAEWVVASAPCDVAVARPHRLALEPR